MEKICAVIVFLAVYQFAGMFHYHDAPVLERYQLVDTCNAVYGIFSNGRLCR